MSLRPSQTMTRRASYSGPMDNGSASHHGDGPPFVVYVVLTHRDWPQVKRLIGAILASSPTGRILVWHDNRRENFPSAFDDPRVEIRLHRLNTDWGSWELVAATLLAFSYASDRFDPDLVCLISGQDYPIRPLGPWEAEAISADSWIGSAEALSYTPRWGTRLGEGRDEWTRYAYRWFQTPAARAGIQLQGRAGRTWRRVRDAVSLRAEPVISLRVVSRGRGVYYGIRRLRSPFSAQRPCFSGSQWLAVRKPEIDWLLTELRPTSRLRRAYESSIIPDESALVTPLAWRAHPSSLPPVSLVEWDSTQDQPTTLTLTNLSKLVESGSPFCRKVDPVASADLMDVLDRISRA